MNKTPTTESLLKERDSLKKLISEINSKYIEKIEELSLLRKLSDSLRDITDFPSMCKTVVSVIQEELDPDSCSLMIVDEEKGELILKAAKGPYDREAHFIEDLSQASSFKIGEAIAGIVAMEGKFILVQDVLSDPRYIIREEGKKGIRSLLCLPLVLGERIIGVLNLSNSTPNSFAPEIERILSIISNATAVALENTRLYEKLRESRDRLAHENVGLKTQILKKFSSENIIGTSPSFAEIMRITEKVSGVDVNVLITGESGTGKEMIARTLHYKSPRLECPFIAVNCASLPENLLESELFGIEKGVATGVEKRPGKFEIAQSGTIFLDEVGDMSLSTQAKILRVIQEREFQRVGSNRTIKLDVRIISATNKNLIDEVEKGSFREDLYYRLKVVEIHLPPLRKRRDDIPLLANYFLRIFSEKHKKGEKWLSREAMDVLTAAQWNGNVRELENVIEQAVILSSSEIITPDDIYITGSKSKSCVGIFIPENRMDYKQTMQEVMDIAEEQIISNALKNSDNNRTKAARILGIGRRTLLYKLNKTGGSEWK